jgi:glycosyltransferase involved in cell wall biosynthesis
MRILFVDASRNGWGTEQHLVALADALAVNGHTVSAVVRTGSPVAAMLAKRGIRTYATALRGGADPRAVLAIVRAIWLEMPDWLVTSRSKLYWTVWALGRLLSVKIALFRHLPDVRRWLTRCVLPHLVDRFFVVSGFARDRLVSDGAPAARIGVLYNPIDIDRLRPALVHRAESRLKLGIRPEDLVVGFVGRVEHQKGVHVLCDALLPLMSRVPTLHLLCVGDGPELDRCRRAVVRAGIAARCHFTGWTAAVHDQYPAMDVLVAPSTTPETFCRVIAEAQAAGLAVIGTRVGGLPEAFLPGISGVLVPPGDVRALRRAIAHVLGDRARRARLAASGQRNAQIRFASTRIAEEFVHALLDGPPLPAIARVNSDGFTTGVAQPGARQSRPADRHLDNAADRRSI